MRLFLLCVVCAAFVSCSKDESYDASALRNIKWQLSSFQLSQPVDRNLDGVASTDMVSEIPCIATEWIQLNSTGDGFFFYSGDYVTTLIGNGQSQSECNPGGGFSGYGTFRMINQNTLKLRYEHLLGTIIGFDPIEKTFKIENNKLVAEETRDYAATYNENTQTWTTAEMFVRREFTPHQ